VQSRKAYIPLRDRDAVRFSEFLEQSGLGRSKGYELLNTGQVETFVVGKARFVVVQSWLDFIDRQRQAQQVFKPNWHPPGRPRRNSAPEGYLLTGRHGLFSCYEAFIHIVRGWARSGGLWRGHDFCGSTPGFSSICS
jgi:hypothetical protein